MKVVRIRSTSFAWFIAGLNSDEKACVHDHHRLWAGSSQALGRIITGFRQDHHRLWAGSSQALGYTLE